jgi:hypothetical protein
MEYYLGIKRNKIVSYARKWIELVMIMLNEISHAQKDKCVFAYVFNQDLKV